jgi:hypothetical protein
MNRKERRARTLEARRIARNMQHFSRCVVHHSEELKNLDPELPQSERKKVFDREARRLLNNKTVILPRVLEQNGITY